VPVATSKRFTQIAALGLLALVLTGCSTTLGSVHVYGGISYGPGEALPVAERGTATPTIAPTPDVWATVKPDLTLTPPPTFTPIPSVTPQATRTTAPVSCSVTVMIPGGVFKRSGAGTTYPVTGGIAQGWTVRLDNIVNRGDYLWGRDIADGGWFAMRAGGVWWVKWGEDCPYPYQQ
jgi:hypothetical protein